MVPDPNSSDVFISYARKDDGAGFVNRLHEELEADFRILAKRDLRIFFDRHDIRLLDDWRDKILAGLQSSRLFLACLSPDYFRSDPCRWEWAEWIKHELARGQSGAGIACIYFVEIKSLTSPERAEATRWMEDLQRRHGLVFAPWYPLGPDALLAEDARARLREVNQHVAEKLDQLDLARDVPGNLDALNPGFVGRGSELAALHKAVRLAPVGIVTAVQGLGGMGKTALALHYAHGYGREYPGGRWQLRCEHQHDLNTVITQINQTLQLQYTEAESKDTHAQAEKILAHCLRLGPTLLLLDNVDGPSLLSAAQTASILGKPNLHLLFTTRLPKKEFPGLPRGSEFLVLDQLHPADALELIRQHQPGGVFPNDQEQSAAAEIIKELAGITLAIETAAIYLGQHASQILPSAYLTRVRADLLEYHERAARSLEGAVRHGVPEITATLRPTLGSLPLVERTILALAALSAPDAVMLPWLREVAGAHHPELLQAPQLGELDPWTEHITHLTGLRLLRPTEEPRVLAMHRVLQEVVRACHAGPLDELEKQLHDHAWSRATFLREGWVHHENRWEIIPLAATAEHWMPHPDGTGSRLAGQLFGPLQNLQHFGKAESLLLSALSTLLVLAPKAGLTPRIIVQRLPDFPKHPNVSPLLNNLAQLLLATNRLAEAEPLLRRALAIHEDSFGPEHPDVAIVLNNLARLLQDTKRLEEAESLYRRALAIDEASFGPEHPNMAIRLNSLATLLHETKRLGEAEPLFRRALAIDETSFGPEHPKVAIRLNNLTTLLQALNRLEEAEPLTRRAVLIYLKFTRVTGYPHPHLRGALSNYVGLYQKMQVPMEALWPPMFALFDEAGLDANQKQEIFTKVFG